MLALNGRFFLAHTLIFLTTMGILAVFLFIYYLIRRHQIFWPENKKFLGIIRPLFVFFVGILNLFYIGFFFWGSQKEILVIPFVFFTMIGLCYNLWYSYIFITPIIIAWLVTANHLGYNAAWNGVFFLTLTTNWLILCVFRLLKWHHWWQFFLAKGFNLGLDLWIIFLIIGGRDIAWFACILSFNTLTFFLTWAIFRRFQIIYDHLERLNRNIVYDEEYFINNKYAHNFIHHKIREGNVDTGLIILFNFLNLETVASTFGNFATIKIKKIIMRELKNHFGDEGPLFYRTKFGEYACFVPIEQIETITLKKWYDQQHNPYLDKILQTLSVIPNTICYEGITEQIKIHTAISIYGIHSCELDELENICRLNLKNIPQDHPTLIQINNPMWTYFSYYDPHDYSKLNQLLPSEDFFLKLKKYHNAYEQECNCITHGLMNYEQICHAAEKQNIGDLTRRFIAKQTINAFKKQSDWHETKIIIDYPIQFLSHDHFSAHLLKIGIENSGLKMEQVIWRFSEDCLITPSVKQHLKMLKKYGSEILMN